MSGGTTGLAARPIFMIASLAMAFSSSEDPSLLCKTILNTLRA
jgi:hypothetical protein